MAWQFQPSLMCGKEIKFETTWGWVNNIFGWTIKGITADIFSFLCWFCLYSCCMSLRCPCPYWLEFSKKVNTKSSLIVQMLFEIRCGFMYPVTLWLVMMQEWKQHRFSLFWEEKKNNKRRQFTWQTYFSVSGEIWVRPSGVWWIERGQEVVNPVQICPSVQNNTDPVARWCKIGLITESLKLDALSLSTLPVARGVSLTEYFICSRANSSYMCWNVSVAWSLTKMVFVEAKEFYNSWRKPLIAFPFISTTHSFIFWCSTQFKICHLSSWTLNVLSQSPGYRCTSCLLKKKKNINNDHFLLSCCETMYCEKRYKNKLELNWNMTWNKRGPNWAKTHIGPFHAFYAHYS